MIFRIVGFCYLSTCANGAYAFSVEDLLKGLEDIEVATKSFSVDVFVTFDKEYVTKDTPVISTHSSYLQDRNGRLRLNRSETRLLSYKSGYQEKGVIDCIAAFNGSSLRQMEGRRGNFDFGRVSGDLGDLPWGEKPANFIAYYNDRLVSDVITKEEGKIVFTSVDGTMTVDTKEAKAKSTGFVYKYRFVIDANFSITEKSMMVREQAGEENWYAYAKMKAEGYFRTESGIYAPTVVTKSSFNRGVKINGKLSEPSLRQQTVYKLSNWNFSPAIDDSMFELEFVPGVMVTDMVQGRTYKVAKPLSDDSVVSSISAAEEMVDK